MKRKPQKELKGDINIIETMEKMGNLQLKWKKF